MGLKPFLKWAGGKRWLTSHDHFAVPAHSGTYFEPFLGGGAVFFDTLPTKARLSDANGRLVETYIAIRDAWASVTELLVDHEKNHGRGYYYEERSRQYATAVQRAAQFIYLNRACWNGLYRVNLRGEFNVPIGTKDWIISDNDDFEQTSKALQCAEIVHADFRESISLAKSNDFLFCDPPYTTAHNMNGFVKYNESIFSWQDQISLRDHLALADERGALFFLTNADHQSVRDLYNQNWECTPVSRRSIISGKSAGRSPTTELCVTNYGD